MANKYQEAIRNVIADDEDYTIVFKFNFDKAYEKIRQHHKAVDTLQELIDKYSKSSCEHHCQIVDLIRGQWKATEYDLEVYKSLYNEALNHLEITLGQDKETIDKLLRKVVNGE